MLPEIFTFSEQIWALAGSLGALFSALATNEAIDDYRHSAARTRMVAYKNIVAQAGLFIAQALLSATGWFAVTQPPTPVQFSPVAQTWVFYAAIPAVATVLLITSVWTRLLYWRLFDTADNDGWR
jgi:hypothetical protein